MGADEEGTLAALKGHRSELIGSKLQNATSQELKLSQKRDLDGYIDKEERS